MLPSRGLETILTAGFAAFTPVVLAVVAALSGCIIGVLSGLAARQLHVLGLWEVAAAWSLALMLVAAGHLLQLRRPGVLTAAALIASLAWLMGHHTADAWAFRNEQIRSVAHGGLLLADDAVLHDTDDPAALVDFSLLGETGASGVIGAARVLLSRGLTVQRFAGVSRIVALPSWLHALFYGLQAAFVAVIVGRALGQLVFEPICSRCGSFLRRKRLGAVDATERDRLAAAWREGIRAVPELVKSGGALIATEERCPRGCTHEPGFTLLQRRTIGLSRAHPGAVGSLPPQCDAPAE